MVRAAWLSEHELLVKRLTCFRRQKYWKSENELKHMKKPM